MLWEFIGKIMMFIFYFGNRTQLVPKKVRPYTYITIPVRPIRIANNWISIPKYYAKK